MGVIREDPKHLAEIEAGNTEGSKHIKNAVLRSLSGKTLYIQRVIVHSTFAWDNATQARRCLSDALREKYPDAEFIGFVEDVKNLSGHGEDIRIR